MATWGRSEVRRGLPDLLFVLVLALTVAVPTLHGLVTQSAGTSGGTSGGSSGTSGGTSGGTSNGTSNGTSSGGSGTSGGPGSGGSSGPRTGGSSPHPSQPGGPRGTITASPGHGHTRHPTALASPSPSSGGDPAHQYAHAAETVGTAIVTTIEDLPFWLPLYCLIGALADPDAVPDNPTHLPRDIARACSNIHVSGGGGGSGTSGSSEPAKITAHTRITIEVMPPKDGGTKPEIRVIPQPEDPTDNNLLETLLVIAVVVIVVLALSLVLVLRRRRRTP